MSAPKTRPVFYVVVGALALILASAPYLFGWLSTPDGAVYTGLAYNIDDSAVYFSWMRQAELGHFFQRNQFTTEPQKGVLFNLFFLLLGSIVRVTHLPIAVVYQTARVGCGGLLLWAIVRLLRETLADERARRIAFALVCFGAGFGWIWGLRAPDDGTLHRPIDLWQPEAITFLSLYFSPLFTAALALMVAFFVSVLRGERTGSLRAIVPAAVAGALLGNFHSYDVIHLFFVWVCFRATTDILRRRLDRSGWLRLIVVGLATLPTTAYQYWALRVEPVFYERAFTSATLSMPVYWTLLGFGIPGVLAAVAVVRGKALAAAFRDEPARLLLAVWSVAGIAVSYVPVAFQRKMLMGAHLPICVLAGVVLAAATAKLSGNLPRLAVVGAVLLVLPTNLWFIARDIGRLAVNVGSTPHRPYLTQNEWDALQWLRANTKPSEAVLVAPDPTSGARFPFFALYPHLSVYVPAYAGNVVYYGHWGETAHQQKKMSDTLRFFRAETPDDVRSSILRAGGIRYVLFVNGLATAEIPPQLRYDPVRWPSDLPPYLSRAYENAEISIYRVAEVP